MDLHGGNQLFHAFHQLPFLSPCHRASLGFTPENSSAKTKNLRETEKEDMDIIVTCTGYGEILTTSLEPSPMWERISVGKKDSY